MQSLQQLQNKASEIVLDRPLHSLASLPVPVQALSSLSLLKTNVKTI